MTKILIYSGALVLALTALMIGSYQHGVTTTEFKYNAIIKKADADHAEMIIAAQDRTSRAEHRTQEAIATVDTHYQEKIKNEKVSTDRTIADLRSGALVLRKRLAAQTLPGPVLPGTAASPGGGDGQAPTGLQVPDGEFLIRFADECNAVVNQLDAAQAVIELDRTVK